MRHRLAVGTCLALLLAGSTADGNAQNATGALGASIHIQDGEVQGIRENGITVYRGIPFARPPIGELRWRPPQIEAPWQGILQTTAFKPACMQKGPTLPGMMEEYSEDCLYLNVWSPPPTINRKLAVMVYIYGGGGASGSGSVRLYWGDQLAKKDVIVVTLNYRLGAFGFLAHPGLTKEEGTSGNYGLLDIVAALKWVHSNIAAFGGDPENVTIFGQSAGAYWESMLMVAPGTTGLFRRVIASSGGEFGTEAARDAFPSLSEAEQNGVAYVERFGVSSISEMRQIPADKIVAMDATIVRSGGVGAPNPNIDGHLIPKPVRSAYEAGRQMHVDLLVGSNADEGVNTLGEPMNASGYIAYATAHYGALAKRFLAIYPAGSDAEAAQSQQRAQSDETFWREVTWARFQAKSGRASVFLYRITTVPPFGQWPKLGKVGHGAELPYVFGYPSPTLLTQFEGAEKAALHTRIEDQIQSYWTNFAKTGDPNGPELPEWPRFDLKTEKVMNMDDNFVVVDLPEKAALALLDDYHTAH